MSDIDDINKAYQHGEPVWPYNTTTHNPGKRIVIGVDPAALLGDGGVTVLEITSGGDIQRVLDAYGRNGGRDGSCGA